MDQKNKLKKGQKLAEKAVFLEGALALAKAVIGVVSGSVVLISDAIHSGADLLAIITSWLGLKIAQKKADERFPYGYYKAENLGTLVVSFLILFASWKMFAEGYSRLFVFSSIKIPLLALSVSLIDALILFVFGNYEVKVGEEINSQSLIAMGAENRTHIFSSSAVFIGTLAAYYQIPYLEGIITLAISLLILKIGLSSAKDALFALMDVSPGKEIESKIVKVMEAVPGVEEFFNLRLRRAGPFVYGEVKIGVRKFINVNQAHEMADEIEKRVKKKVPSIDSFSIHIEPLRSKFRHLVVPVREKQGLASKLAGRFGRAPYFLFVNLEKERVKGFYFLENPYKKQSVKAGLAAAKLIAKQKSGFLITKQIGEIAFHSLRDYLVDIYQFKGKVAQEAIDNFVKDRLSLLVEPKEIKSKK